MASKNRLYNIWINMRMRCKHNGKYWGAKGIKVCEEWEDFKVFQKWALEHGYTENLTIDRMDSSKDYCPENCRWATYKQQANNTSRNRIIVINGEARNLNEWLKIYNTVTKSTVFKRVRKGWSFEKAITTPNVRKQGVWRI